MQLEARAGKPVAFPVRHRWLAHWLVAAGHEIDIDPARLKDTLARQGVNGRGWKLYVDYGDGLLQPIAHALLSRDDSVRSLCQALAYLRLLAACESDVAPPVELASALGRCRLPGGLVEAMPAAVFRGAWRALVRAEYMGIPAREFVDAEFVPIVRHAFATRRIEQLDANRGKAAWAWLHARWTEDQARTALPAGRAEWPPLLLDATIGPYRFVPLLSAAALHDEGKVMSHCVGGLDSCCRRGCLHVFSVRRADTLDRCATLAVRAEGQTWTIADLREEGNAFPDARMTAAAMSFLQCVEEAVAPPPEAAERCEECPV